MVSNNNVIVGDTDMSDMRELLLQLVGDESEKAGSSEFLEYVLNRGMAYIPVVIQTGMKQGMKQGRHEAGTDTQSPL